MSKIKNTSEKYRKVLKLVNQNNLYKKLSAYEIEGCEVFYCITHDNKIHISGSSDNGVPPLDVMLDAFNQLTNKDISSFDVMQSEKVLYFIEKDLLN